MYDPLTSPFGSNAKYAPRYYATCAKCGREKLKKRMTAVYVKKDSYSPLRVLCHLCHDCMPSLLDQLGVPMPDDA